MAIGIVAGVLAWTLNGCADLRPEGPRHWGRAPCFSADVVVRLAPPQGDPATFSLAVDRRDDGRIRVDLARLDVQGANMVLEPDGACTVWLPRAHRVARTPATTAPDSDQQPLIAVVRLVAAELADGPETNTHAATGWTVANDGLDADGRPTGKRVLEADGTRVFTVRYERWSHFDDVERPARCHVELADGTAVDLRLRSFRALGGITSERFHLNIPADAPTVPWEKLGEAMGE